MESHSRQYDIETHAIEKRSVFRGWVERRGWKTLFGGNCSATAETEMEHGRPLTLILPCKTFLTL